MRTESRSSSTSRNGPAVKLEGVSVRYRVPHERIPSLKEFALRWVRRRVHYGDFWALHRVDLEVPRGQVFGILGPNGAGKSTLLKVVARVLRPTEGRARVWGSVAPLLDLGAGFDPELTGRENIFLNGMILGYSKADITSRFDRIVDFAELHDFIDAPLRTYSSGMMARLGFAIATDTEPDILIVDEILAVGDAAFQKKSFARIQSFRDTGATILLVSHDLNALQTMCHSVMWLQRGQVAAIGRPREIVEKYLESQIAPTAEGAVEPAGAAVATGLPRALITVERLPEVMKAGMAVRVQVTVRNLGPAAWPSSDEGRNPVNLSYHWRGVDGEIVVFDGARTSLREEVAPRQSRNLEAAVEPPTEAGVYVLEFDLVQEGVAWFADRGSPTTRVTVTVR